MMVRKPCLHPRPPRGFTLVELLLVTLIVAILATLVISAYTGSMELGRSARTRAQIAKVNDLIGPIWESYLTLRISARPTPEQLLQISQQGVPERMAIAGFRLNMLRRTMRYELPDRITDVLPEDLFQDDGSGVLTGVPINRNIPQPTSPDLPSYYSHIRINDEVALMRPPRARLYYRQAKYRMMAQELRWR
jgi:prepilin-type N-terminal cleavage/methylation domain-containing protein